MKASLKHNLLSYRAYFTFRQDGLKQGVINLLIIFFPYLDILCCNSEVISSSLNTTSFILSESSFGQISCIDILCKITFFWKRTIFTYLIFSFNASVECKLETVLFIYLFFSQYVTLLDADTVTTYTHLEQMDAVTTYTHLEQIFPFTSRGWNPRRDVQ